MTTTPDQPTSAPVMNADEAREVLHEMVAVVRTIFGSAAPLAQSQQTDKPHTEVQTPVQAVPAYEVELPTHPQPQAQEPAAPAALSLPEAEPIEAPQTAAVTGVPMPTALAVEGHTVATPGATSPTAAPSTPALAMPAAQPVEVPPLEQAPVINALPMPDYTPPPAETQAPEPQTPERHSMVMLQEIAFLDD